MPRGSDKAAPYLQIIQTALDTKTICPERGIAHLVAFESETHLAEWVDTKVKSSASSKILRIPLRDIAPHLVLTEEEILRQALVGIVITKKPDYSDTVLKYYALVLCAETHSSLEENLGK